ncbi:MAG: shikimate kinase [Pseudomonadota bacterium]
MAGDDTKNDLGFDISKPIVLIGMMGVGKTTVGRRLAPRLNLPFFDADEEIEKAAGMSVSELFASHGEASFRKGEAKVIKRLLDGAPIVLATGGGALTNAQTRSLIQERAVSIWLQADVDVIMKRVSRRPTRPLLNTENPRATVEKLLKDRELYYQAATITIDSQAGPHTTTVSAIINALRDHAARAR